MTAGISSTNRVEGRNGEVGYQGRGSEAAAEQE